MVSEKQFQVTFEPSGRTVFVLPGAKVVEAAARAGMTIDTPCGGMGVCRKCRVRFMKGAPNPLDADRKAFSTAELSAGWRLACQTAIATDALIHVPESSLFASHHQILAESNTGQAQSLDPTVRKQYVELPQPSLREDAPDALRLEQAVGPFHADAQTLQALSLALRRHAFKGTAVFLDHQLAGFEPGDTTACCHGIACDIGTTTLAAVLMDLLTGVEKAVVSRMNPQVAYGDDVLARITHAASVEHGSADLQRALVDELNGMIGALCAAANLSRDQIYEITFAGNATMEHLLCGINPAQLGMAPFVPVFARGLLFSASEIGLHIHPRAMAYVFPLIGGFVGGDTTAGILTTRLAEQSDPVLMIDVGTNGEIVLASGGNLWAASTAAGPAFEGARISCGMRATRGAIEKVVFTEDAHCGVIGNAPPMGLCGSGLIDLGAALLRAGIVSPEGRMRPPALLPPALPGPLRRRVRENEQGGLDFVLAEEDTARGIPAVALSERDVRELQLACGAIRAGIAILLKQAGLTIEDLVHVYVAGGFGSFIRRSSAQQLGLLPPGIPHERIRYVGNASLSGAQWALLSTADRAHAEELARRTRHVELSNDADFAMEFAMAMIFPEMPE